VPFYSAIEVGSYFLWGWFSLAFAASNKISIFKVFIVANIAYILINVMLYLAGLDALPDMK
jgi:hypothetical protein